MDLATLATRLRALALDYPETYEEQPWGERVVKVKGKIFFFCGVHEKKLHATLKLPKSGRAVLQRAYAEPTHYGMGKHGWVTLRFATAKEVPVDEIKAWLHESFLAVAPKILVKRLGGAAEAKQLSQRRADNYGVAGGGRRARAPAASAKGAATATALLVCGDALRAERALAALRAVGVRCSVVPSLALGKLGRARALIVDLGRNPREGLALAEALDASDRAVHLFVVGVRDAEQARRVRQLGSAEAFRAPPGDEKVVAAVAKVFAPRHRRAGVRRLRARTVLA
jgi:predicted DNA-binding protein (MmcQ/YjbR family)